MSVTGEEGRPPVKCGVPVGDFAPASTRRYVILAAVMRARRDRQGRAISTARCSARCSASRRSRPASTSAPASPRAGSVPRIRATRPTRASRPPTSRSRSRPAMTSSGATPARSSVARTCRTIRASRRKGCAPGTRTRSPKSSQPIFSTRTAEEWLTELDAKGIPCAPINDFAEILADPHVREAGWVRDVVMPNGAQGRNSRFPDRHDGLRLRDHPHAAASWRAQR